MDCFLIDGGTTNTRVWMRRGGELRGPQRLAAGVRDTAVEGNNQKLKRELAGAFGRLAGDGPMPQVAVAAGMITSPLGLMEVPHCQAPTGARELAAGAREVDFAEFPGIRWLLLPGVRSGALEYDLQSVAGVDIIRGEETEVVGALASAVVQPPLLYIHAGSHTKAIRVDGEGRITGGVSTLAGELRDAVRRHTILSSAVAGAEQPEVSLELLEAGAEHARRDGLTRALFLVRLLEQRRAWQPEQLDSFLLGALIEMDLAAIMGRLPQETPGTFHHAWGSQEPSVTVTTLVSAPDAALSAWTALLARRGVQAIALGSAAREACFLAGIQHILSFRE